MSSMRQALAPSRNTSPRRLSYTISSSSSPTRRWSCVNTPKSPRSGIVPPLAMAILPAPSRARTTSVRRSQTIRGRSSPNSSDGYRPASRSSTLRSSSSESSAKFAAPRTRRPSSSTVRSSTAHIATICCARTSSGLRGYLVSSMRPSSIRFTTTAASSRSPRYLGKSLPREGSPTWWPARPMRWIPRPTEPGDSTCTTRSTAPMSMPSSSELVATMAFSVPRLRRSSISRRCSRAIDPWWAATRSSPASSFRRAASRSASRRAFTNTIVDRCCRISSNRRGWIAGQMLTRSGPAAAGPERGSSETRPSSDMSSIGTTTSTSIGLRWPASTIVTGRGPVGVWPPRNRAISSSGRWVADRPIRCAGCGVIASSRSSESARCAPRLVAASAWISSTMTQRTLRRISRVREVSIR